MNIKTLIVSAFAGLIFISSAFALPLDQIAQQQLIIQQQQEQAR
jgi:hypothetical protein